MDLEKPGVPVYLDAQEPISIDAKALIPNGNYRARVLQPNQPKGWRQYPMLKAVILPVQGESCQSRQVAIKAIFEAKTVSEFAQRKEAFVAALPEARCAFLERTFVGQLDRLSPELSYFLEPIEGVDLRLVVERYDDAGTVLQTFEWPVVLPPAAPVVTETAWIVQDIAERIAFFARGRGGVTVTPKEGSPSQFVVSLGEGAASITIDVATGVWDAANFKPLATALGVKRSAKRKLVYSTDMLTSLAKPMVGSLLAANDELRLALKSDPKNSATHEAAALLLATAALRSSSTGLEDIRPLLNRATAHLALAAVTDTIRGLEGEIAGVAVDILVGRQVAAASHLKTSKALFEPLAARAWQRALLMRATGDWRIYSAATTPTLLEQVEHARALARSWSQPRAAEFWKKNAIFPDSVLWGRAILGDTTPVELGNELSARQLKVEMAEAAELAAHFHDADARRWLQARGETAGLDPISPDLWARMAEGSVADAAWKLEQHLVNSASLTVNRFRLQIASDLPLAPTMQAVAASWKDRGAEGLADKCPDIAKSIGADPFRLSVRAFGLAAQGCSELGRAFPKVEARIAPWSPTGTLFDFKNRLTIPQLLSKADGADWPLLRNMTFYEPMILGWGVGTAEKRDPVPAEYRAFVAEREYSLALFRDWRFVTSTRGRMADAIEPGRAACELDLDECTLLIDILNSQGLSDEAFAVAQRVYAPGVPLTVAQANASVWIVDENIRRGKIREAVEIADRAGAVGSEAGLIIQARVAERMHNVKAPLLYAELDRKTGAHETEAFALRRLARTKPRRADLARAISNLGPPDWIMLPNGQKVSGYLAKHVLEDSGVIRRFQAQGMGLRPGDVIVGLNGFPIANSHQFWGVLGLNDEPIVELTVRSAERPGPVTLRGKLSRADHELLSLGRLVGR